MRFNVEYCKENGWEKYVLTDLQNSTMAEVIPPCGGILNAFNIRHRGSIINVIEGYDDAEDFRTNVHTKGFRSAKLSPFVCRINKASYNWENKSYKLAKFLLNGAAIHGLLYDLPFEVKLHGADDEGAFIHLSRLYERMDEGYPFPFNCSIEYKLVAGNKLNIKTIIENRSHDLIPVTDGWHPYFQLGTNINSLLLQIKGKEILEYNEELIPTGRYLTETDYFYSHPVGSRHFDDCFILDFANEQPLCSLIDETAGLRLNIYPGKSYPYLQIYTPPHRKSIAIENLSGIPDAYNNGIGLTVLPPAATAEFNTLFEIIAVIP